MALSEDIVYSRRYGPTSTTDSIGLGIIRFHIVAS